MELNDGFNADRAVAIVGVGAILPDAPNAPAFWQNICNKRYSIIEVPPERWRIADYYDPDPDAPDKPTAKSAAWVRGFQFDLEALPHPTQSRRGHGRKPTVGGDDCRRSVGRLWLSPTAA